MRKLNKAIAAVTTLAIAASMAAPAFAATFDADNPGEFNENVDVMATYILPERVYNLDVDWDNLAFEFDGGHWNTTDHQYDNVEWTKDTGTIKVTNHSNDAVNVNFKATASVKGVSLTVDGSTGPVDKTLETAEGNGIDNPLTMKGEAKDVTVDIKASGRPEKALDGDVIGTIAVTLS